MERQYGFDQSYYDSDLGMKDFIDAQRLKIRKMMEDKAINANTVIRGIIRSDLIQFFNSERDKLIAEAQEKYINPNQNIMINLNYLNEVTRINKYIENKLETELVNILNKLEEVDEQKPLTTAFSIPNYLRRPTLDSLDNPDDFIVGDPLIKSKIEAEVIDEIMMKMKIAKDEVKQLMKLDPSNPTINTLRNKIIYYYKNFIENKSELYQEVKKRLVTYKTPHIESQVIMNQDSTTPYFESTRSRTGLQMRNRVEDETSGIQRSMYGYVLVNESSLPSRKKSIHDIKR